MQLYNTLTRRKEDFAPADGRTFKMYVCGPTVYNFFHIGNARCFVVFDMLRRYLEYRGWAVEMVQNFTDVDDKMIRRANEEQLTLAEVGDKYIREYFTDVNGLGVHRATVHPRATDNIDNIIALVSELIEKQHAYAVGGDVYFSTRTDPDYGKLSGMPIEDLESGARIEVGDVKRDPLDFALWKAAKPDEPSWDSPWGKGRPGWHIECSAMAKRYLGDTIDLHCGATDLIFPHHENEIAQSECANGAQFSRFWAHIGFVNVDNEKMSKSKGNFFTVRDIAAKYGYGPIRFFLLSAHYRKPINFSEDVIIAAKTSLERIQTALRDSEFIIGKLPADSLREGEDTAAFDSRRAQFIEAMDDDFNTADGLAAIFELVRDLNRAANPQQPANRAFIEYGYSVLRELCDLMGFTDISCSPSGADGGASDDGDIDALVAERAAAKKAKNFKRADEIRDGLKARGIVLEDTPMGTKWRKAD